MIRYLSIMEAADKSRWWPITGFTISGAPPPAGTKFKVFGSVRINPFSNPDGPQRYEVFAKLAGSPVEFDTSGLQYSCEEDFQIAFGEELKCRDIWMGDLRPMDIPKNED